MKILALDLSTQSTGWCIYDGTKLQNFNLITASSTDVIKRIKKITNEIQHILNTNSDICEIIIEEVRPQNNQYGVGNLHTHRVLMWLQASVNFMIHDNFPNIQIKYVYPNEWRAACGIKTGAGVKRKSLKQADINFVKQQYGVDVNDDIADAIGIGHAYINKINNEMNWE